MPRMVMSPGSPGPAKAAIGRVMLPMLFQKTGSQARPYQVGLNGAPEIDALNFFEGNRGTARAASWASPRKR